MERLKSYALYVLFALSVMLSVVFLTDQSQLERPRETEISFVAHDLSIADVFRPQGYHISFGGNLYSKVYDEQVRQVLWDEAMENFMLLNSETTVTTVDVESWNEAHRSKSVYFSLPFPLEGVDFFDVLGYEVPEAMATARFDEVTIAAGDGGGIYFASPDRDQIWWIDLPVRGRSLTRLIDDLAQEPFIEYRRVESYFSLRKILAQEGPFVENHYLIPLRMDAPLYTIRVTPEVSLDGGQVDEGAAREIATTVFGSRFDFVKKLNDSDGSIVYMFGYAEKSLKLDSDGTVTYNEKFDPSAYEGPVSFRRGLLIALDRLQRYGEIPDTLTLTGYEAVENPRMSVKTFSFRHRVRGYGLYMPAMHEGHTYEVTLHGDQLVSLKRQTVTYERSIDVSEIVESYRNIDRILNDNFYLISSNFFNDLALDVEEENVTHYVYQLIQEVEDIEVVYYYDRETSNLLPAWKFTILDHTYLFGIYEGKLLNIRVQ